MTDTEHAPPNYTPVTGSDRATGRATDRATTESVPKRPSTRAARLRARGGSVAAPVPATHSGHADTDDDALTASTGSRDGWWWLRARWWNEGPNAPGPTLLTTRAYHAALVEAGEPGIVIYPYKVLAVLSVALSVTAALIGCLARPGRLTLALVVLGVLAAVGYGTGFAELFTDPAPASPAPTGGVAP